MHDFSRDRKNNIALKMIAFWGAFFRPWYVISASISLCVFFVLIVINWMKSCQFEFYLKGLSSPFVYHCSDALPFFVFVFFCFIGSRHDESPSQSVYQQSAFCKLDGLWNKTSGQGKGTDSLWKKLKVHRQTERRKKNVDYDVFHWSIYEKYFH